MPPLVMVRLNAWVSVPPPETCTVKLLVWAVVGIPEMTPAVLKVKPAGSDDPEASDQVYGVVPPVAVRVWLYATPTVPLGRVVVVIDRAAGAGLIVIDSALVAVAGVAALSVTCTVKLQVIAFVGVPEMTPVAELRVRPPGNAPALIDQV